MCRSKNFECWLRRISLVGACVFLGNGNVGRSQQIEELSQPPLAAEAAAEVSQLPDVPLVGESPFGILESEDDEAGVQTLTRGPLHEAFAEPLIWDPRPGLIVPKTPPPEINEVAPDFTPDGDDAIWISGYWGWDEQSEDFIWISGVYRVPPDEHRWVPGYWHQVDTGWQWVQGLWVLESSESIEYLPLPPASLENGPSSPSPPGNESFYIPGYWSQAIQGYAWNAGYWHPLQSDFIWIPSHYVWSPRGCVFVSGYWDRRLPLRGFCFAPAAIQYATYSRPGWSWRPRVVLNSQVVLHNLFVQPGYNHYLFGDYYAPRRIQHRVLPAYLYHQQRGGFDPLISFYSAYNTRQGSDLIRWYGNRFLDLQSHPANRPPQIWNSSLVHSNKHPGTSHADGNQEAIAHRLDQIVGTLHGSKVVPLSASVKNEQLIRNIERKQFGKDRELSERAAITSPAFGSIIQPNKMVQSLTLPPTIKSNRNVDHETKSSKLPEKPRHLPISRDRLSSTETVNKLPPYTTRQRIENNPQVRNNQSIDLNSTSRRPPQALEFQSQQNNPRRIDIPNPTDFTKHNKQMDPRIVQPINPPALPRLPKPLPDLRNHRQEALTSPGKSSGETRSKQAIQTINPPGLTQPNLKRFSEPPRLQSPGVGDTRRSGPKGGDKGHGGSKNK